MTEPVHREWVHTTAIIISVVVMLTLIGYDFM